MTMARNLTFAIIASLTGACSTTTAGADRITLTFEQDGVTLVGDLHLPAGDAVVPAVVIIQGSGDSGRSNHWSRLFAEAFQGMGYAALLPDKRGSGESGGDWHTADFDTLARDAVAAADRIRSHPRVDADQVGYIGLSQGGRIAPMAALIDCGARFTINVSGSMQPMAQQLYDELELAYRAHGLDDEAVAYLQRIAYASIDYARTGADEDWSRYLSLHREISAGPLGAATESWPDDRSDPYWHFWSNVWDEDPVPHWRALVATRRIPALVLYGTGDRNVDTQGSVAIAQDLVMHDAFTVRVYADGGHALLASDGDRLRDDVLADLEVWLAAALVHRPNGACR